MAINNVRITKNPQINKTEHLYEKNETIEKDCRHEKNITFLTLILVSALLISCSDKEQVADEIVEYHNEKWIPISNFKKDETEKLTNEFIKLDSKKDKTEATELIKDEIIPLNEDVVSKLENLDPKNKETKKINDLQLKAEEFALEIFNNIIKYYEGEMTESELAEDKKSSIPCMKMLLNTTKKYLKSII